MNTKLLAGYEDSELLRILHNRGYVLKATGSTDLLTLHIPAGEKIPLDGFSDYELKRELERRGWKVEMTLDQLSLSL